MGLEDVPRCQHLKVNGVQCGSPALRRRRRCYFHEGIRLEQEKFYADQFAQRRFELRPLEDANAVQLGLMKVIEWLGCGRLEPRIAGLMLYALQTLQSEQYEIRSGETHRRGHRSKYGSSGPASTARNGSRAISGRTKTGRKKNQARMTP